MNKIILTTATALAVFTLTSCTKQKVQLTVVGSNAKVIANNSTGIILKKGDTVHISTVGGSTWSIENDGARAKDYLYKQYHKDAVVQIASID